MLQSIGNYEHGVVKTCSAMSKKSVQLTSRPQYLRLLVVRVGPVYQAVCAMDTNNMIGSNVSGPQITRKLKLIVPCVSFLETCAEYSTSV